MRAIYAEWTAKQPWFPVALGLALAAAAALVAVSAPSRMGIGSFALEPVEPTDSLVRVVTTGRSVTPASGVYDVGLDVITAQLSSDPDVARVERSDGAEHGGVVLEVTLAEISALEREQAVRRFEETIDPGPLRVSVEGETSSLLDARDAIADEGWRPLLLALPALVLVCCLVLGLISGVATALAAAAAAALAAGLASALGPGLELALPGLLAGVIVAIALALELSVLLVTRHREALALGAGKEAGGLALAEWTPVALASPIAAALTPLALLLTPLSQAGSLAAGCALGALSAPLAVLLIVLPLLRHAKPAADPTPAESRLIRRLAGTRTGAISSAVLGAALVAGFVLCLDAGSAGIAAPAESGSLPAELPRAALAAAGIAALAGALAGRSSRLLVAGPLAVGAAAGAIASAAVAFGQPVDGSSLDINGSGLETAAIAIAIASVAAIAAARAVMAACGFRDERMLGADAMVAAARAAGPLLRAAMVSTLALGAAALALVATAEYELIRQLGLVVAAGLALDAIVVLPLTLALAVRVRLPRLPSRSSTLGG